MRPNERFGEAFLPTLLSRAYLAWCHAELGRFAVGRAFGEEGLRIAELVAHPASLMWLSCAIGRLALLQGDLPRALPQLERAMGLCQDADLSVYFLWTAALERVDIQALCLLPLGEAQMLAGRLEEAHTLAEGILALTREHQERGHQAYALRLLGDLVARRDPPEAGLAEAHYCQGLILAEALGMRPLQAHCHRGLGTLYARIGQRQQARSELSTAIELYRAMEMTFWLPQAEAMLAQMA